MRAIVTLAVAAAALAGCAAQQQILGPTRSLPEMMPRFQLACSAKGLRPGTDAFEGCVRGEVAAWRGTSDARDAAPAEPPAAAPGAKPATPSAPPECRLSPLGGYDCGRR